MIFVFGEYMRLVIDSSRRIYEARTTPKTRAAIDQLEDVFKALADKTRLRILALLGNNEVCVCHIHDSLGLPQPTVVASSRVSAHERARGRPPRRRVDALPGLEVARSGHSSASSRLPWTRCGQLPATREDRKQFQRSFGQLYVLDSPPVARAVRLQQA